MATAHVPHMPQLHVPHDSRAVLAAAAATLAVGIGAGLGIYALTDDDAIPAPQVNVVLPAGGTESGPNEAATAAAVGETSSGPDEAATAASLGGNR